MNEEKFIVAKHIKEFIMMLDDYLINYPRKYYELRNRLVNDSYELLEIIYTANYMEVEERKSLQVKGIMKISLIDFYIEQSFKKRIISEKQSIRLSKKLLNINKLLRSWYEYKY